MTNPHLDIVEQFETLDGVITPLDYSAQYDNLAQFFEGRDKRLAQSIIYPGGEFLGETYEIYKEVRVKKLAGATQVFAYNNATDWRNEGTVPDYPQFTQSGIDGNFPDPGIEGTSVYGFYIKKLFPELKAYLIGDMEVDILAAQGGGAVALVVAWTVLRELDFLRSYNPDDIIKKPEDLIKI